MSDATSALRDQEAVHREELAQLRRLAEAGARLARKHREERDEERAQLAVVRAWRKGLGEGYAGPGGIILDLDAALAAAKPPAPTAWVQAASVLDAEADRWDKMNGMSWCSMVGQSLHRRADEMREEAKK